MKGKRLTQDELIANFCKVHSNRYDYSRVSFHKTYEKVCIICFVHGEFWQRANSHAAGRGCQKCARDKNSFISEEREKIFKDLQSKKEKKRLRNIQEANITKICNSSICGKKGIEQPIINFHFDKSKKDGRCSTCKNCAKKRANLWRIENPEQERARKKKWAQGKDYKYKRAGIIRRMTPHLRVKNMVSTRIREILKKQNFVKGGKTFEALPHTSQQLKEHIEKQFDENMNWDNYGTYWQIDHILPQAAVPYDSLEHPNFQKCWALENLRPLEASENLSKGSLYKGERYTYEQERSKENIT